MSETVNQTRRIVPVTLLLDRVGKIATLLLPVFLVHFRGIAEGLLDLIAAGFIARSAVTANCTWTTRPFVLLTFAWWIWIDISSGVQQSHGEGGVLLQSLLAIRFPVAAFGLAFWTLNDRQTRTWLRRILLGCVVYFAAQFLLQALTGHNLFGDPRFGDGTLTGPYDKPRATAPFARMTLPVSLWLGALFAARAKSVWLRVSSFTLCLLPAVILLVLAGQRMALATFLLGVAIAAVFIPKLRVQAMALAVTLPLLILSLLVLAPQAFGHLVVKTEAQLAHFSESDYGLIYNRAVLMTYRHPFLGLGYDAYRHHCRDIVFQQPGPFGDTPQGGGYRICVQHAHNHWLEAASNGGFVGLFLFSAMIVSWLYTLAIPLLKKNIRLEFPLLYAWQVGLFAAFFTQEWPLASSSAFLNMPLGGIAFTLLGIGMWWPIHLSQTKKVSTL